PLSEPKMISSSCKIGPNMNRQSWLGSKQGSDFEHSCDTEGGSSGAPVFDEQYSLIGLHHHGFDLDAATCEPKDKVNKAVRVQAILDQLKSDKPALFAEISNGN